MNLLPGKRNPQAVSRSWSAVRGGVPVLAALIAAFLLPLPVHADQTVDYSTTLYSVPGLCVWGQSELVRHDTATALWNVGLYPSAILQTFSSCTGGQWTFRMMPAGWLAMHPLLLVWTGSSWGTCHDFGWIYNDGFPAESLGWVDNNGRGSFPCGAGYYGTFTDFYAWDGSAWQGGWVWSGYLYSD
jgi:hypothetical protein